MCIMTVQEFLDQMDGVKAVAAKLDLPLTTVQSWAHRNAVPEWRVPALAALAAKEQKPYPADFGPRRKVAA